MSDLNWCTYCDKAISPLSESLYCSEHCLRADALRNHPLLGYNYEEFVDFPRPYPKQSTSTLTITSAVASNNSNTMGPSSPALSVSTDNLSCPSMHPSPSLTATASSSPTASSIMTRSSGQLTPSTRFDLLSEKVDNGISTALPAPLHHYL